MRLSLTQKVLAELQFDGRQRLVRDTQAPGLCVLVSKNRKSFAVQIDGSRNGRRVSKRRVFGHWPEMSVATARRLAPAERLVLAEKSRARELTLADAWLDYRRWLESKQRSTRTIENYDWLWVKVLRPKYGAMTLSKLCSDDWAEHVRDDHTATTARYRANRCYELLRAIHRHAHKGRPRSVPAESPTRLVLWNRETKPRGGRGTAMSLSDLAQWYKEVRELPDSHRQRFHLINLLSGSRQTALSEARWEHVDVEARVLHLPTPKGGSEAAYDIPLSEQGL